VGSFVARSEQLKGSRLGGYEVARLIGHGATASVFEATHIALGKRVAVKILHEHLAADEQVRSRFLREGRIAARLRHPNTVEVIDVGVEGGAPYLVMELLTGTDLRALLAETHHLAVEHALAFLLPIASALAQAHEEGVIHRDLKPANIFLARDLRDDVVPKLVDFGLSKVTSDETSSALTATELVAGTVLYMAPEQTLGVRHSSAASDQYSLAAILYECITGEPPFRADGVYALIERIRTEAVRPPSQLAPRLPPALDAVILRALHRDPAQRHAGIRAFARSLLPYASEITRSIFERDFVEQRGASAKVPVRPPTPPHIAEVSPERTPSASAVRSAAHVPCPPGKGPFHIKGMSYRGFVFLVNKLLPGGMDAFCGALDDEHLRSFVRQPFLASGRYDIFPFLPLFVALSRQLDMPFEGLVRGTAAAQARYDGRTVFKAIWNVNAPGGIAERITRFGAQYYDFGKLTGTLPEPNVLDIVHAGVPAYVYPWYAPMHVAYTEECVRFLGGIEVTSEPPQAVLAGTHEGYALVTARTQLRWKGPT
jgi:serine/threonine protein kinase